MAIQIIKMFKEKKLQIKNATIPVLFLVFVTFWLRLVYLGYSDYQGDEIKAMYRPEPGQNAYEFLMDQRKGPLQFFITAAMKPITDNYYDNFVLRLPFALAGILSVWVFYQFVKIHFGKEAAYISAFLFSVNGFFVAFSRIVQYQSFTILFFLLALYFFSRALEEDRWKFTGWYVGGAFWGLSALAHYDAIFIFPFVLYIYIKWFKKYTQISLKDKILTTVYAALITLAILSTFYVPFALQLTGNQLNYWNERLVNTSDKISSSLYTFSIYNPIFVAWFYLVFLVLSLFKFRKLVPILIWAAFPLIFMEYLAGVPGTHIYTYILPLIVAASMGILVLKGFVDEKAHVLLTSVLFLLLFVLSFAVFVDHRVEYPWTSKKFLFWTMEKPELTYHLSIFGFPYYRHWEEIEVYLREHNTIGIFGTNERKTIPRLYLEEFSKDGKDAQHFVLIDNPQSFSEDILQSKPYYWIRILKKPHTVVYKNGDETVSRIFEMPIGDLDHLKDLHFQGII